MMQPICADGAESKAFERRCLVDARSRTAGSDAGKVLSRSLRRTNASDVSLTASPIAPSLSATVGSGGGGGGGGGGGTAC